jgi:hypothetical protein
VPAARRGRSKPPSNSAALARITAEWPEPRSLANSAALFLLPEVAGDSVRPGNFALRRGDRRGASGGHARAEGRHGAGVQDHRGAAVEPGNAVGYGSRFVATRPARVGVVACGYADGYPRHAPDGTPVLVDGVRVPLVGRVSMDMITVDLTDVPRPASGRPSNYGARGLPIDEVANAAGTVGLRADVRAGAAGAALVEASDGQAAYAVRLLGMRRRESEVAGAVPALQRMEHAGRGARRVRGRGRTPLRAAGADAAVQSLEAGAGEGGAAPARPASTSSTACSAAGWSKAVSC